MLFLWAAAMNHLLYYHTCNSLKQTHRHTEPYTAGNMTIFSFYIVVFTLMWFRVHRSVQLQSTWCCKQTENRTSPTDQSWDIISQYGVNTDISKTVHVVCKKRLCKDRINWKLKTVAASIWIHRTAQTRQLNRGHTGPWCTSTLISFELHHLQWDCVSNCAQSMAFRLWPQAIVVSGWVAALP